MQKKLFFGMIAILLIASVSAFEDHSSALDYLYKTDRCNVEFYEDIMKSISKAVPGANNSFADERALMKNSIDPLKKASKNKNAEAYREYTLSNFSITLDRASSSIREWRTKHVRNYSISEKMKESMKEDYDDARESFEECISDNLKKASELRISEYGKDLKYLELRINALEELGINVTNIRLVIDDARLKVILPLQDAIENASTSQEIKKAYTSFCLYDDCKKGYNYHLAAKYEVEKLLAIIAYLEENVKDNQSLEDLNNARVALIRVKGLAFYGLAGAVYADTPSSITIWKTIKESYNIIGDSRNQMIKENKSSKQPKQTSNTPKSTVTGRTILEQSKADTFSDDSKINKTKTN